MLMGLMLPRFRRLLASSAALFAVTFGVASCERVPLLAPTGSTITLTSTASSLPFNGSADIIAQVIEASGTPPHSGTTISFTTNLGTFQTADAETDVAGRVVVKFLAGTTSGTANIIALSGGVNSGTTTSGTTTTTGNALKIAIGAAAVGSITASASPATLRSTGGTSTITATVGDVVGSPLPGVPVTFAVDTATGATGAGSLSASVVTTDANGHAETTLTTTRTTAVMATAGIGTASGTPPTGGAQTAKVPVTVNAGPSITFGAVTPSSPVEGQLVTFQITIAAPGTTGSPLRSLSVDFGDGATQDQTPGSSTAVTASHVYGSSGNYTVTALATDTNGDTGSARTAVSISRVSPPTVVVTVPDGATPNTVTKITITATPSTVSKSPIQSVAVNFGDGTRKTLTGNPGSVQHVYSAAGTFTISAVATDENGASGSGSAVIVVGGGTVASFTVLPTSPTAGAEAAFDASASTPQGSIVSYAWDFGDGTTSSPVSIPTEKHTFATAGSYNVRLTITDTAHHQASVVKQITVQQ